MERCFCLKSASPFKFVTILRVNKSKAHGFIYIHRAGLIYYIVIFA